MDNCTKININKCHVLHFGSKHLVHNFKLSGIYLSCSESERDLGVQVDVDFKFRSHINSIANKCFKLLYFCFKFLTIKNKSIQLKFYKSYVLPIIDYGSCVYSPQQKILINQLESVQKYFTRKVLTGNQNLSYSQRLKILNLESLEIRRIKLDLLTLFKIKNNLAHTNDIIFRNSYLSVIHCNTRLQSNFSNTSVRYNYFTNRVIRYYNSLPLSIRSIDNLSKFRKSLTPHVIAKFILGRA